MNNELNFISEQNAANEYEGLIGHGESIFSCLNGNGTETIYIYTAPMLKEPIKITKHENKHISSGGYFEVVIPDVLSMGSGISIGGFINLIPADDETKQKKYYADLKEQNNVFGQKRKSVSYRDFLGENIDMDCYVTNFGLNMEIIVPEYTQNNTFSIRLNQPNSLIPMINSPDYLEFREDSEIKSLIYMPLAVDANNKWCYKNRADISGIQSDGSYIISYIIDKDFMEDPNTKYPVRLNQSVYVYKPKQSDTAMYSATGDTGTHHLSPYMLLGDSTIKGEGWGFVRYEGLYDFDIPTDKIISAEYCFNNLFDQERQMKIGAFAVINDWCSINTRWNTKPGHEEMPVKTIHVKDRGVYSIDITKLFIEMMKGKELYEPPRSVRNSFFIRSLTKDSNLLLAAGDSGIFSPYLKIIVQSDGL